MIDIRTEIRDAFEREQSAFPPPAALRAQVVAEVSAHARASAPARQRAGRDLSWLMGAAAILLAIAIVAGLLAVRLANSHQTPVKHGPASQLCVSGPTGPSDRFATVHGYITYTYGSEIWAVDPKDPAKRISLGPSDGMAPIAWSRTGNRLLLLERRDAGSAGIKWDLCVMNADGSQTRLTSDGLTTEGSLSPDGTKAVFSREAEDGLYVVDAKGGTPQLIANATANVGSLAWSPDGSRIAFIAYEEAPMPSAIWTVNPDGTDPQKLPLGECEGVPCSVGGGLAWAPDGSMLAFDSSFGNPSRTAIYVVRVDGSGLHRINDDGFQPSWSPDGSRIAFLRSYGFSEVSLYTMARDGSDTRLVEGVSVSPYGLAWNPVP
jgi:TolB protein